MATVNGSNSITNGSGDAVCRAELDWTKSSDTNTYVIYKLSVYIYCIRYGYTTNGALSATLSCSGQTSKSVSGQSCSLSSGGRKQLISTVSYKFEKKTSSWSPSIKFTVKSTGSSVHGTSTGTFSPTISALTSYNVTYNNNGGSGSIATQKKYYGKSLTLAKSGFTRTNYTLIGWNTSSAGTGTHYNLGATYTTNAARSLYAEWKQNYIAPKITNLKCYRVNSSQPEVGVDDGQSIRVTFNYTGGTVNGGTSYIIPSCSITIGGTTVRQDAALSSTTGSFADVFGGPYSTTSSYKVTVTLHDTTGNVNTVASATVGPATFPIDLLANGNDVCMGVMHPAQSGTKLITAPLKVDGELTGQSIKLSGGITTWNHGSQIGDRVQLEGGTDWTTNVPASSSSSTTAGTWYQLGSINLTVGRWIIIVRARFTPKDSGNHYSSINISTTSKLEAVRDRRYGTGTYYNQHSTSMIISLASDAPVYVNGMSSVAGTWTRTNNSAFTIDAIRIL